MAAVTEAQAAGVATGSSWIDRLTAAVDALPGPSVAIYGAIGFAFFAVMTISQWMASGYVVGTFSEFHAALALLFAGFFWLVGRFNEGARAAVNSLPEDRLRHPSRRALLERRLTALPPTATIVICLGGVVMDVGRFLVDPIGTSRLAGVTPSSLPVMLVLFGLFAGVAFAYGFKVVMLSWQIHHVLSTEVVVSLFDVAPLYAFSRLTAAMATSLIAAITLVFVTGPVTLADLQWFVGAILGIGFAALAFFLPLAGVHGLLVNEKERRLAVARVHLEASASSLHDAIQTGDSAAIDPLQKALAGIEIEQRMLERAPTWPWQADTFRWVVGAVMFPIALYVVQVAITRLLDG